MFKRLDGVIFNITGTANADGHSPVEGITINAYHQKLMVKNVKAKIIGKVIINNL
jgi:hypothetical protein